MNKYKLLVVSFALFLLTSCVPAPTQTPTATTTAIITPTITMTPTPMFIATLTPTSTPTETPLPTPTPFPASAFSAQVIGYGEHGAMLELLYDGNLNDLDSVVSSVVVKQNGRIMEIQAFQSIGEKYLAEMTDSYYEIGEIDVTITLKGENETQISQTITFDRAIPWMNYLYGESPLSDRLSYPWDPHHLDAWDLQPVSSQYPNADGHPVYSPCKGMVVKAEIIPEHVMGEGYDDTHILYILCEYTGFLVHLGHTAFEDYVSWGDTVENNSIIGVLHWEKIISRPHNHFQVYQFTPSRYKVIQSYVKRGNMEVDRAMLGDLIVVDAFSPHRALGGEPLTYGLWLEDTLPLEVIEMIDSGRFKWPDEK